MMMARSYHLHERLVFMLRFVKAQFPDSQKHYDYICDLDDIQKLKQTKPSEKVYIFMCGYVILHLSLLFCIFEGEL